MTMNRINIVLGALLSLSLIAACQTRDEQAADRGDESMADREMYTGPTLVAELSPTEGNTAEGVVSFTATADGGVIVAAHITGLTPGKHGFHIHENGDCSAPDASSAGGHFNPAGTPHGAPSNPADARHAGDLGNIEADSSGMAHFETTDAVLSLDGSSSIHGKAVVVHEGADDLATQPSGAAGARVACGVIGTRE